MPTKPKKEDNKLYDPKKFVDKDVYRDALRSTNQLRKLAGKKPLTKLPFGRPGITSCPLFFALKDIGVTSVGSGTIGGKVRTRTGEIIDFVDNFVRGVKILGVKTDLPVGDVPVVDEAFDNFEAFVDEFDSEVDRLVYEENDSYDYL